MRIGWVSYNSLRREVHAPRGAVDQYYTVIPALHQLTDEPVHWMQFKYMTPDCHIPNPHVAEADELEVHRHIIHYQDMFKEFAVHVNNLPTVDRWNASERTPFDTSRFKFQVPFVDVVILESTGQMASAHVLDGILRLLWRVNPNIGLVLFDQDICCGTVCSKIKKWLPNWEQRVIIVSHHFYRYSMQNQAVALSPHLDYRNQTPVDTITGICYVGNDYKRREPMKRLMQGQYFHHYGKVKGDFEAEFRDTGINIHGPFIPSAQFNIEALYRQYGTGVHCLREDAYKMNLIAVRLSEIARAGCLAFCDHQLAIGKALSGEQFCVRDAAEIMQKFIKLYYEPELMQQWIRWQQQAMGYWTSSERYIESMWRCCQKVAEGPIRERWELNRYLDLCELCSVRQWGRYDA